MTGLFVFAALASIAAVLLSTPFFAVAWSASRGTEVLCPDSGEVALVRRSPAAAMRAVVTGETPPVLGCSRWPEKAGCDRACEACLEL